MDKLIELLQQISDLAGVGMDALKGGKPDHGGGDKPPMHEGGDKPPMHEGGGKPPEGDGNGPPEAGEHEKKF